MQRTDVFRLLLDVTPELEMMAHATLRLRAEAKAPSTDEIVDERFTVRLQGEWLKKLDRVVDDLARKDVDVERTFVARSLVHAEHDVPALVRQAAKFVAAHPDRRFREEKGK
jgi:Golgi nucleoside diphosphatase